MKSSAYIEEIADAPLVVQEEKKVRFQDAQATPLPQPPLPPVPSPTSSPSGPEEKKQADRMFMVYRDRVYMGVTGKFIQQNGLNLDGEVYEMKSDSMNLVDKNKHRFITNESFNPPYSLTSHDDTNPEKILKINEFLSRQGKIPSYLTIAATNGKGLGVFAKENISAGTYIGKVEGMYRPLEQVPATNNYAMGVPNFDGSPAAVLDTENMTFSNWGRFLNDSSSPPNCALHHVNYSVLVFAVRDITGGQELTVPYGDSYWSDASRGKKVL